jgi:hypothetical protein
VINIVKQLAKTGNDKINKKVVTKIDQINNEIEIIFIKSILIFLVELIKLILPKIDLIPAK